MKTIRLQLFKLKQVMKSAVFARCAFIIFFMSVIVKIATSTNVVCIIEDGSPKYVATLLETEEELIERYEINVEQQDRVNFSGFTDGTYAELEIERAFPVTVKSDGNEHTYYAFNETVGEVLDTLGIDLGEQDEINKSLIMQVQPEEEIVVDRITYRTGEEVTKIPREIEERPSTVIKEGSTKIIQGGTDGEQAVEYKEKLVNGEVVEKEILKSSVRKEPQKEVRLLGVVMEASPDPLEADGLKYHLDNSVLASRGTVLKKQSKPANASPGAPDDYLYILEHQSATAYSAKPGARTASGMPAKVGHVAVNPNIIPYGSKLYIETEDGKYIYGYAVAADTGTALMDGRADVDLFFDTYEESVAFGRRWVRIYVLP